MSKVEVNVRNEKANATNTEGVETSNDMFDWETGEYTERRSLLYGSNRMLLYWILYAMGVLCLISAYFLARSAPYSIYAETFPAEPHWRAELSRSLAFTGGVTASWMGTLIMLELGPVLIHWWCQSFGREIPATVISLYSHLFFSTLSIGRAVASLIAAFLAPRLYPPPELIKAVAGGQASVISQESMLKWLDSAATAQKMSERDHAILEALREFLIMSVEKPKEKPAIDASKHIASIVYNLAEMPWQVIFVRVIYILALYFCLSLVGKVILSQIATVFHRHTLQQRLNDSQLALSIVKRLKMRFLLPNEHYKHAQMASIIYDKMVPDGQLMGPECLKEYVSLQDADAFMELIDLDSNGNVSKAEFVMAVQGFYTERDYLNASMVGNNKIIDQIGALFNATSTGVSVLAILIFLDKSIWSTVKMIGGTILSLTFVFGGTAADAFQSILFILFSHPFDVGDKVVIDGKSLKVKELGLWSCSFTTSDNSTVYICNHATRNAKIANTRRSGKQSEQYVVRLDSKVTEEQLESFESCMNEWIRANNRDFEAFKLEDLVLNDRDRMTVGLKLVHKSNFQEGGVKDKRSKQFVYQVRNSLQKIGIQLAPPLY